EFVRISVVAHIRPGEAHFRHRYCRGKGVEVEYSIKQHTGRHRRIEVRPVFGCERTRPVVPGRYVEIYFVIPTERGKTVQAVDYFLAPRIVRTWEDSAWNVINVVYTRNIKLIELYLVSSV